MREIITVSEDVVIIAVGSVFSEDMERDNNLWWGALFCVLVPALNCKPETPDDLVFLESLILQLPLLLLLLILHTSTVIICTYRRKVRYCYSYPLYIDFFNRYISTTTPV